MVVFTFQTGWSDKPNYITCLFFSLYGFRGITCHDICSCQLAGVTRNITGKYFRVLCSEDWDSVRRRSRSHCSVSVLRMCFNHFSSWRVCLPSGWSAVLLATWRYKSSAAKYVLKFLKTMTHHYGESWGKKVPILIYSSLFTAWRLRWAQRVMYSQTERWGVGGESKLQKLVAHASDCVAVALRMCFQMRWIYLHDFTSMGRFYQHAKSPSDSSLAHRGAGPKQCNLEVKKT